MAEQQERPSLKCPFCGAHKFDDGRDILVGPQQVLYCRQTPRPGWLPGQALSLRMKGTVCLACGYVAMMVDAKELHAPVFMPVDPAVAALNKQASQGGDDDAVQREAVEALEALENMQAGDADPQPAPRAKTQAELAPVELDPPPADDLPAAPIETAPPEAAAKTAEEARVDQQVFDHVVEALDQVAEPAPADPAPAQTTPAGQEQFVPGQIAQTLENIGALREVTAAIEKIGASKEVAEALEKINAFREVFEALEKLGATKEAA